MQLNPSKFKEEKLLIILQALHDLGYAKTVQQLEEETDIRQEPENVKKLRDLIVNLNWDEAILFTSSMGLDEILQNEIILILLEQWYLHLLYQNETQKAVEILRKRIQPICQDNEKMHKLATSLMIQMTSQQQMEEDELADESGKLPLKPPMEIFCEVLAKCHKYMSEFQPKRLETLLIQAKCKQILDMQWFSGLEDDFSLYKQEESNLRFDKQHDFAMKIHNDEVWFCQFSQNGKLLATADKQARVCVWEFKASDQQSNKIKLGWKLILNHEKVHTQPIHFITFSPCSQLLGTCSQDQTAKIFLLSPEQKLLYTLKGHQQRICGLAWKFNGKNNEPQKKQYFSFFNKKQPSADIVDFWEIYTGSIDGWITTWKNGQKKGGFKTEPVSLMFIFNDKMLIEHAPLHKIALYDVYKRNEIHSISIQDEIVSTCLNQNNTLMLVNISYINPKLHLYDVETFQHLRTFTGFAQQKFCLRPCFGWFKQNLIAIGSEDGHLYMWHKYRERYPILKQKLSGSTINAVAFNPSYPQMFAIACDDHSLKIFCPPEIEFDSQEKETKETTEQKEQRESSRFFNLLTYMMSHRGSQQLVQGDQQIPFEEEQQSDEEIEQEEPSAENSFQ